MKLSCSAKKKQPPPDPSPEAGLAGGLAGGLEAGVEAGLEGGKPSKTFQTLNSLQNPPNTFPNRHPRAKATSQSGPPRAKATAMAFYWLSKLPFASPQTLQTLQNPPNTPNTIQNPPNPPGLEACFEQVAQGL